MSGTKPKTIRLTSENVDEMAARETDFFRVRKEKEEEAAKAISPPGTFPHLPELLDRRRQQYLILDEVFDYQATYDRIYIVQVGAGEQETYKGGPIVRPETYEYAEQNTAPFGIIVSAGLKALDSIKSHGIDLGHIICHTRVSPYRIIVANPVLYGYEIQVLVAGDIAGSVDLARAMRSGKCRVEFDEETRQHNYVDEKGGVWNPAERVGSGDAV